MPAVFGIFLTLCVRVRVCVSLFCKESEVKRVSCVSSLEKKGNTWSVNRDSDSRRIFFCLLETTARKGKEMEAWHQNCIDMEHTRTVI